MIAQQLLEGKRIFVVEDDTTNMALIAVILKHHGALVIQDHWNANTLSLIRLNTPLDIILLDLMLRYGVSGYDIFKQLQRDPELAQIPVVAVSASDPNIEIPKAHELGMSGFISKPINMQHFPQQVAQCIERRPVWSSSYQPFT